MIDRYTYTERAVKPLSLKLNPIWWLKNDDEQKLDDGTTGWRGTEPVRLPARGAGPQLHGDWTLPSAVARLAVVRDQAWRRAPAVRELQWLQECIAAGLAALWLLCRHGLALYVIVLLAAVPAVVI